MNFIKKLAVVLSAMLLPVMLFTFGSLVNTYQILNSPDLVKTAIDKSGLYDSVVPSILQQVQKSSDNPQAATQDQLPLDNPELQSIINKSVSPDYIKQQTNGALDSIFAVVQGKESSLNLQINLEDAKTKLAENLGAYTETRLASLPACTSLNQVDPSTFNPLTAECVPPGIDKAAAAKQVQTQLLNNNEFLKNPVITSETLQPTNEKPIDKQLKLASNIYKLTKLGLWITSVASVILAIGIILLSITRRAGMRRVAVIAISTGASAAALALILTFALKAAAQTLAKNASDATIQARLVAAINYATNDLRNWWIGYGVGLVLAGIAGLVALKFIKPVSPAPETPNVTAELPTEHKTEPPTSAPPTVLN